MRKTHKYMVGYDADHQTAYGKDERDYSYRDGDRNYAMVPRWADPMTLAGARRKLKQLVDTPKTIYLLVPVEENGRKKK